MAKSEPRLSRVEQQVRAANASADNVHRKMDVHRWLRTSRVRLRRDTTGRVHSKE